MNSKSGKYGMPLFFMMAVVLTLTSSLFLMGSVHAAIESPVLKYELTGQNVNLTWDAVANASSYNVYYSADNSTFALLGSTNATHYVYTQDWNTTRYYYVVAVNGTDKSSPSNVVKVITPAGSSGAGAGFGIGSFTVPVYKPYLWLGAIFMGFGIMILLAARAASGRHRIAEFWGVLFLFIGAVIVLASVAVVYFHML